MHPTPPKIIEVQAAQPGINATQTMNMAPKIMEPKAEQAIERYADTN